MSSFSLFLRLQADLRELWRRLDAAPVLDPLAFIACMFASVVKIIRKPEGSIDAYVAFEQPDIMLAFGCFDGDLFAS